MKSSNNLTIALASLTLLLLFLATGCAHSGPIAGLDSAYVVGSLMVSRKPASEPLCTLQNQAYNSDCISQAGCFYDCLMTLTTDSTKTCQHICQLGGAGGTTP